MHAVALGSHVRKFSGHQTKKARFDSHEEAFIMHWDGWLVPAGVVFFLVPLSGIFFPSALCSDVRHTVRAMW